MASAASAVPTPEPPRRRAEARRPATPSLSAERARRARTTMEALHGDRDVFETFFEAARIGLALADLSLGIVRVNDSYAALLGVPAEDLIGRTLADVLDDVGAIADVLSGRVDAVQTEQQYVRPDGHAVWLLHGVATVTRDDGAPAWYALSAQDVTERRRAEQDLRDLTGVLTERAVRDPLTGVANRALLEERLRTSLARDARSGAATGVLFLDLDGFKAVNDRYGHATGDAVLRAVAQRLTDAVRPADTVARLGGDEFVVLVEGATEAVLDALVDRLRGAVTAPVDVPGRSLQVGVSIGSALCRGGEGDPPALLAQADARMYAAKRRPRRR
jgi:diguanylate cyclase (GGDEF)-like protein/PAS domain S-box-containing protein